MDKEEIIRRLKKISEHAVHVTGEPPFILSLDDGIALNEAVSLLKEQEETIRNLEQEIRDKNERLKERAEQVDSMLKERKPVEPSRDIALNRRCPKCFAILKGKFCHKCGQAVKWND